MTQPVVHRSQPPRFANEKPSEAGFSVHEELEPVGDELRWRCAKAAAEPTATFELWRANEEDRDFCLRMLRFGRRHLGGFVAAGHDDEGLWLVRRGLLLGARQQACFGGFHACCPAPPVDATHSRLSAYAHPE